MQQVWWSHTSWPLLKNTNRIRPGGCGRAGVLCSTAVLPRWSCVARSGKLCIGLGRTMHVSHRPAFCRACRTSSQLSSVRVAEKTQFFQRRHRHAFRIEVQNSAVLCDQAGLGRKRSNRTAICILFCVGPCACRFRIFTMMGLFAHLTLFCKSGCVDICHTCKLSVHVRPEF